MNLSEKGKAVTDLFHELDQSIQAFQEKSGIYCKFGCGHCCFKADIEATVLEFLPFALDLHGRNETVRWLHKVGTSGSVCAILDPGQSGAGLCSQYAIRGLICRLFGYSGRVNKHGRRELVTCTIIKTEQAVQYQQTADAVTQERLDIPLMNNYYMKLYSIDPDLSREHYPINVALRKAIELVMHQQAYAEFQ